LKVCETEQPAESERLKMFQNWKLT